MTWLDRYYDSNAYLFETTDYGFKWGPMYVDRCCSDDRHGVLLRVSNKLFPYDARRYVDIRISPSGKVIAVRTGGPVVVSVGPGGRLKQEKERK